MSFRDLVTRPWLDFESLTTLYESALSIADDDVLKQRHLVEIGRVGTRSYESNKEMRRVDVTDISISAFQLALTLTPSWDHDLLTLLNRSLGHVFMQRYELSKKIEDINQAIFVLQEGIALTPENDESLATQLSHLGTVFRCRFMRTEELRDLTEEIDLHRAAVSLTSQEGRLRPGFLYNLSTSLRERFSFAQDLHDIEEAIVIMQDVIEKMDLEDPQYLPSLKQLAECFKARFDYSEDANDIEQAVSLHHQAVDRRPEDPALLMTLGIAYQSYFMRTGEVSYIDVAIDAQRKALSLISTDSEDDRTITHIFNLGMSLGYRYLGTGSIDDLEEAIELEQSAIYIGGDDYARIRQVYNDLGNLYHYRSRHTQDIHDMRESVRAHKEGVLRTPTGHSHLPGCLNNLGNSLRRLSKAASTTEREAHLSEAITAYKDAVSLVSDQKVAQMDCLSNLGGALYDRYLLTRQRCDLDDGLSALRKSVTICPPDHARLPNNLHQLASALQALLEEDHRIEIMEEAISVMDWAVTIAGAGGLSDSLKVLADLFFTRFRTTQNNEDIKRATSLYRQATQMHVGSPITRMYCARGWGFLSLSKNIEEAFQAFQIIFHEIIPQLAWIGRTVEQRYLVLSDLAKIVSEATAVAIQCGKNHTAVEWLEQGRSVVWNQVNNFHIPLEDIQKVDSSLAEELEKTGFALQEASMRTDMSGSSGRSIAQNVSIQRSVREHQNLAKKWDSLLSRVRKINGFEKFLCPIHFTDLTMALPSSGFVVVINTDRLSSDALVLGHNNLSETLTRIRTVQLSDFYERANHLREQLNDHLSDPVTRTRTLRKGRLATSKKTPFSIKELLRELWYEVVKPILDAIQLEPTSNPPRIWWCPTGSLSFLPTHAAGDYDATCPGSNIMEYVVSSYTPTIAALTQSLCKYRQQPTREFKGMLAVSESEAPGLPPIPSTDKENGAIKHIFKSLSLNVKSLKGKEATVKSVSDNMSLYSWIHFSCHALQDDSRPLYSAFYLHDGQLTLKEIIKKPDPLSQFAFLSGCETGKGDKKLSEEAIHLAAGMLTAGYSSVVATMWSISDLYAPQIADDFYMYMLQKGHATSGTEHRPDCTRAAAALHHSIGRFRKLNGDDEESLLLWVPYIHVGI